MMESPADLIRARVAEVDGRLAALETTANLLRDERQELLTALKVLQRFSGEDDDAPPAPEPDMERRRYLIQALIGPDVEAVEHEVAKRKPAGTPTVPEMIMEILLRPHLLGDPGMEPKDITAKIRERWWPKAPSQSVGPIAWRMSKDGRLVKDGQLYRLPPDPPPPGLFTEEAPTAAA